MLAKLITFIALAFCFSSCSTSRLVVQTKYFSHEDLASFYVNTPDPLQNSPPIGQSLLMFWNVRNELALASEIEIRYIIRLRNKEEVKGSFPIKRPRGYYTYSLYNDDYFKSGGILTYKVELLQDGEVLEEWRQHLWKERIVFAPPGTDED